MIKTLTPLLGSKKTASPDDFPVEEENLNSSISEDSYYFGNDAIDDEVFFANGNADYVTVDFLKTQLESLRQNLSTIQQQSAALDLTNENENNLQEERLRSSGSRVNGNLNINRFNHLQTNVDVLNTSVAVQGSMLQQAIRAMGEYDRR